MNWPTTTGYRRTISIIILLVLLLIPSLQVAGAVVVYTYSATKITGDTAQLNGRLDDLGGNTSYYAWFDWGKTAGYGNSTSFKYLASADNLTFTLDDLEPYTTYHYRIAVVQVPLLGQTDRIIFGSDQSFTTTAQPTKGFSFQAVPAFNVYEDSATLNARILNLGKYQSVTVWFEWGTSALYGRVSPIQKKDNAFPFQSIISGLSPATIYHWRAILQSTLTGAPRIVTPDMSFKTLESGVKGPSLNLLPVSDLSATSATVSLNISLPTAYLGSRYWFEWGQQPGFKESSPSLVRQSSGVAKMNVSGLNPNNLYYLRAGMEAPSGRNEVFYSDNIVFNTLSLPYAQVITRIATSVGATFATFNALVAEPQGGGIQKVWFEYDDVPGYSKSSGAVEMMDGGPYTIDIAGLKPSTSYHYRAVTLASGRLQHSEGSSFITSPVNGPVIRTLEASYQSAGSILFKGEIDIPSAGNAAKVWFEYGKDTSYGRLTSVQERSASGVFAINAQSLEQVELIHFRAVADVSGLQIPGNDLILERYQPTSVEPDNMTVIAADGETVLIATPPNWKSADTSSIAWLEWGMTTDYSRTTPAMVLSRGDTYSVFIPGLNPNTYYHYRMVLMTGNSVRKGHDQLLNTGAIKILTATTLPAESISDTTVILRSRLAIGLRGETTTWFNWGVTETYSNSTAPSPIVANGELATRLTGLRRNTIYYFQTIAASGTEMVVGNRMSFRTALSPGPENQVVIETTPPIELTPQACILTSRVESLGGRQRLALWFEYGIDTALGNRTENQTVSAPGTYRFGIKGLTPGTNYYYRTVISTENSPAGRIETPTVSFSTPLPNSPVFLLRTLPVSGLTAGSATLKGSLDYIWGYPSLQSWFEWGNTTQYGNRTPATMVSNPGSIEAAISGLLPGATYHFRVAAAGPNGAAQYGTDQAFQTTQSKIFSVTTGTADNVAADSARLNGQVVAMGSFQALRIYFEWGQSMKYGQRTPEQIITSPVTVFDRLDGLSQGVTYHYRLVAVAIGDTQTIAIGDDRTLIPARPPSPPGAFGCQGPR